MMTTTLRLTRSDLNQFSGSERWFRSAVNKNVLYTEGAQYVADAGGAYWLLDEIAIAQRYIGQVTREEFQVWKLTVRADRTAALTCEDGNCKLVHSQEIEFTDFPLDEITLWFANNVIYLPSEH
jgi:hypothetical protein